MRIASLPAFFTAVCLAALAPTGCADPEAVRSEAKEQRTVAAP